ncbi:MAG: hypothetical protein IJE82_00140 [Alphaproteobacteria bacterium]|nr:hypothetical protein [Alphaproteobacteria bacterium]
MVKVIGITENDPITGVKYGTIEVKENVSKIEQAKSAVAKVQATRAKKIRGERTKNK